MGVGYQYVGDVLNDSLTLKLMLTLLVLKLVATAVSLRIWECRWDFWSEPVSGSDAGRGGWKRGAAFLPSYVASPGAYALVGMGAAFAGIIRAPTDVGGDDFFEITAGLFRNCAADAFEPGELFHCHHGCRRADL